MTETFLLPMSAEDGQAELDTRPGELHHDYLLLFLGTVVARRAVNSKVVGSTPTGRVLFGSVFYHSSLLPCLHPDPVIQAGFKRQ